MTGTMKGDIKMALKSIVLRNLSVDKLVSYLDLCGYNVRFDFEFSAAKILIDTPFVAGLIKDFNMEGLCAWSKPAEFSVSTLPCSFVYVK